MGVGVQQLDEELVEGRRLSRKVRERDSPTDYEMILIINCRADGKSWDWISNAIDRLR
jgi:hypothetical protein